MKRIISLLVLICILIVNTTFVWADGDIKVLVDEKVLSFDVPPQIIDGRTMVPMRKIFEALGAAVTWDEVSKTATGKKGDTIVNVSIDSKILFKNGVPKVLDVAPALIEGRTLVPARAIAESFDCEVTWIPESKIVKITSKEIPEEEKIKLTALEISEKVSKSVFHIEVYDMQRYPIAAGSGFFITEDGIAVTNYNIINGGYEAEITTASGDVFNVERIIAFDKEINLAIIKVGNISAKGEKFSQFPKVKTGNSDKIKSGWTVYALGSPEPMQNTISNGIISNASWQVGEENFMQITAAVSYPTSGGALVDEYGEVVAITSVAIDKQEISAAIPINVLERFDLTAEGKTFEEFASEVIVFNLMLSEFEIEIEVGETKEILVYADGKAEDWSIFWHADKDELVKCEWGDWLEEFSSVCPLKITGLKEGMAIITIYSNVDYKGKDIIVHITPNGEFYKSSSAMVPTYTHVTGVELKNTGHYEEEGTTVYAYPCAKIDPVQAYVDYLLENGFEFYGKEEHEGGMFYYYKSEENGEVSVVLPYGYDEVYIVVPD